MLQDEQSAPTQRTPLPHYTGAQELRPGERGRAGRIGCLVTVTLTVAALAWAAVEFFRSVDRAFGPPDNHVAAQDSRVCSQTTGNNVSLADVTDHFELVVPSDATHLIFSASVSSLQGEYDLSLRFTTTAAGLVSFLDASHLSKPSATTEVTVGDWSFRPVGTEPQGPCGLIPPNDQQHVVYSQDSPSGPMGDSPRSVAVDLSDPARPEVWVEALDL